MFLRSAEPVGTYYAGTNPELIQPRDVLREPLESRGWYSHTSRTIAGRLKCPPHTLTSVTHPKLRVKQERTQ